MARVAYWFRTDLRLHDSPALAKALKVNGGNLESFHPIWCWDPTYVYRTRVGPNRWQFLLDSMQEVSDSLTRLNPKSQLFVLRGAPVDVLTHFFKACNITHLFFEKDNDEYVAQRDADVKALCEKMGVHVESIHGHTLWDPEEILAAHNGKPPLTYASYTKTADSLGAPPKPIPAPTSIPSPEGLISNKDFSKKPKDIAKYLAKDVNHPHRLVDSRDTVYTKMSGPNGTFSVPTMEELAMKPATTFIRGGESRGLAVLQEWLEERKQEALLFEKPKTSPAAFKKPETTLLSPHLKFGTLSIRKFYWSIRELEAQAKKHSSPPVNLIGQVVFRDMYHCAQAGTPNYNRIHGNRICRFIDWELRNQFDEDGEERSELVIDDSNREAHERFLAWKEGRTGYPWIDAQMRKLKKDGWIHHLGRHSVACFLTRQLYISWERGAEVFDAWLIDWCPQSNSGNWMWLSCSAFMHQYYRVYSPISFGQKWDKKGDFVREYVPELKDFPDKYVYAPWTAPAEVQKKAGCIVGEDYPAPIVDDKQSKALCIARIKRAYAAGLYGDDPRVLDGTAEAYVRGLEEIKDDEFVSSTTTTAGSAVKRTKDEADDERRHLKQQKLK